MTGGSDKALIFTDEAGNDYRPPWSEFARCQVPDEQRAEIEQALRREDVAVFGQDFHRPITSLAAPPLSPTITFLGALDWKVR